MTVAQDKKHKKYTQGCKTSTIKLNIFVKTPVHEDSVKMFCTA